MDTEELKLLLSLEIQALGQQVFNDIAAGLEGVAAQAAELSPALGAAAGGVIALVGATAALTAGLGASVAAAADWQTKLTEVANNTNMSNAAMAQMNDAILGMAQTTSAPLSQLADGWMHVANMGFQGADAATVLQAAMESAVSTGGNVADTANVLANVMHEFGLSANQAGQAMDVLHTAAALGNMTLEQMVNSFGPVAAIASTIGVPLDQASAAMAALTKHGFDAAEAGTQLKNFLEKIAAPTAGARAEMQKLADTTGVDLTPDFTQAGLATKGLTGVLQDIARATNGNVDAFNQLMGGAQLTTTQMNALAQASHGNIQALQQLDPNIRGLYAEFILTGRGAGDYLDILRQVDQSTQGAGITAESYARTQATLGFQLGVLKNNLQVAAVEIGTDFLPALTAAVQWISGTALPVIEGLVGLIAGSLQPAVAAIGAEWQRVTAAFQGGGLLGALQQLLSAIGSFAQSMFGAGWNLVETFGAGMMQAADSVITAVVNEIASLISSFFVGNSPPPAGPLAQIQQGGQTLMQTYTQGMQSGLGGLQAVAGAVSSALGNIPVAAGGPLLAKNYADAKAQLDAMKGSAATVSDVLNQVNSAVQQVTYNEQQAQFAADQIKASYDAQIQPLQDQLDALRQQVDYTQQLRDANESVQAAQLDAAILGDQGDPVKKAALESQLQALQQQQKSLDLQAQIADIEAQKKQAAGNKDKLAALNLQEQELQIQQQIQGLVNQPKLAADTAAKNQLAALQAQQQAAEKVAAAQQHIKELGLEQQIQKLKDEEQQKLAPINAQLEAYKQQLSVLNFEKGQLTDLKSELTGAAGQASSLASSLKGAGAALHGLSGGGVPKLPAVGGGGLPGVPGTGAGGLGAVAQDAAQAATQAVNTAMQASIAAAQAKAQEAARKWVDGFKAGIEQQANGLFSGISAALGGVQTALAPVEAAFGRFLAQLRPVAQLVQTQFLPALRDGAAAVQTQLLPALNGLAGTLGTLIRPTVAAIVDVVTTDLLPAFVKIVSYVVGTLAPAIARIASVVATDVQPALQDLIGWITANVLPAFNEAGGAVSTFVDQVLPRITAVLQNLIIPGVTQLMTDLAALWDQDWTGIETFLSGIWQAIEGVIKLTWDVITGIVKIALDLLAGNWKQAWTDLKQMLQDAWNDFQQIIGGGFKAMLGLMQTFFDTVLALIKGFAPDFANAGEALIEGLKQGIMAKAQDILQAITGIVQGAINAAKSLLHISSPSQVFAAIGQQMAAGLVQGLEGSAAGVKVAVGTVTSAAAQGAVTTPAGQGAAAGVQITITGNYLLSDRDLTDLATQVGRVLVQQTGLATSIRRR